MNYQYCYIFNHAGGTIVRLMLQEATKTPKDFGSAEELLDYWGFNPDECSWMFSNEDLTIDDLYLPIK